MHMKTQSSISRDCALVRKGHAIVQVIDFINFIFWKGSPRDQDCKEMLQLQQVPVDRFRKLLRNSGLLA